MNQIDLQKLKQLFDKEKIKSNKKLLAYLFFVVLSTIFWFLNALSKEYTTDLNYPVYYVNMPQNKVLTSKLPNKLNLRVTAYGFDLLRYKLSTAFLSNSFDVEHFTNKRLQNGQSNRVALLTSGIKQEIEKELSDGIKIESILPDTILFEFSGLMEKKIPVRLEADLKYDQQFKQGDAMVLEPDSVLVIGPESFLDSISEVKTKLLKLEDLNKTVSKHVGLQNTSDLKFIPKKIKVTVPVQRFTEAKKNVTLKVDHLPDSMLLRLFPGEVSVSYFVGMNKYESITEDDFELSVDYIEAAQSGVNKLQVKLNRKPDFVSNIRLYPQNVSFLIEKRK